MCIRDRKKVEAGEILFFETAEEERAFWTDEDNADLKKSLLSKGSIDMTLADGTKGAIVSLVSNDDCPFTLVGETNSKDASGDVPYYIANEASVKALEAGGGATNKRLGSEGNAYTDIAPDTEMPIGTVTLGKDQSIVVSLSCEDSSDCSVIEVGLKKENSSEKLVIKEAGGDFGGLTAERSVEESGEYVLYVKNTGKTSAGFSISYLVR